MSRAWLSVATLPIAFVLAFVLGVLLVDGDSEPSDAVDARTASRRDISAVSVPRSTRDELDAMLRARTLALEQLADQCTPSRWGAAEAARDAASEAQGGGDVETALSGYEQARILYAEAGAEATERLALGGCRVGAGPTLELPPIGSGTDPDEGPFVEVDASEDPTLERRDTRARDERAPNLPREEASEDRARAPRTAGERIRAAFGRARVPDSDELALRTEASKLVEAGRACDAVRLLEARGQSVRSERLARALTPVCRTQQRGQ